MKKESGIKERSYPWQGLVLDDGSVTLEECLQKIVKEFPKLRRLRDVAASIESYRNYMIDQGADADPVYSEEVLILSKEVFTIRCNVGLCHFLLEYNGVEEDDDYNDELDDESDAESETGKKKKKRKPSLVAGFTLENTMNGTRLFAQNIQKHTAAEWEEMDDTIFSIID